MNLIKENKQILKESPIFSAPRPYIPEGGLYYICCPQYNKNYIFGIYNEAEDIENISFDNNRKLYNALIGCSNSVDEICNKAIFFRNKSDAQNYLRVTNNLYGGYSIFYVSKIHATVCAPQGFVELYSTIHTYPENRVKVLVNKAFLLSFSNGAECLNVCKVDNNIDESLIKESPIFSSPQIGKHFKPTDGIYYLKYQNSATTRHVIMSYNQE